MFTTRCTGIFSAAPAEAWMTACVTGAERRSGITTQRACSCSAERVIAPRLCGSWIWSSTTTTSPFLRASSRPCTHSENVAAGSYDARIAMPPCLPPLTARSSSGRDM